MSTIHISGKNLQLYPRCFFSRPRNLRLQGVWRGMWQLWENEMEVIVKMEKTNTWVEGGDVMLCMIYINNPTCLCCIFSTTYEANLKRHMRGHNPECDQCNHEGNHRANFECHVRSTHSNLWYQCVLCEFNVSRKGNLNNHVQMKHEGVVFGCDDSTKQSSKQ